MESGGVSESRGAESAHGASGASEAKESGGVSAADRSDVSAAAASVSDRDVSAQADAVAGKDTAADGFDRAEAAGTDKADKADAAGKADGPAAGPGRGPSEGTVAEASRRADEAESAREAARETARGEALGRGVDGASAAGPGRGPSEGTVAEASRRADEAESAREAARETARGNALGRAGTVDGVENTRRTPSEGTLAEIGRREENKRVEAVADRLGALSPTAQRLVDDFRANGGTFVRSERGGWFNNAGERPVIGVPRGTPEANMLTIAHELGHYEFRNNPERAYQAPGRPTGASDRQIEHRRQADYMRGNADANLRDEGHASLVNRVIRDEVLAKTGLDLGVAGNIPSALTQPGAAPQSAQRRSIGDYFGANLFTSTNGENYRSYYSDHYRRDYEARFMPGKER